MSPRQNLDTLGRHKGARILESKLAMHTNITEKFIVVEDDFKIWTRCVGGGALDERTPLLILHGGPGAPHDYLENLAALSSREQRVIFYDQLGCGKSDCPDEPARWHLSRFVHEVETVRNALNLDEVVILGQSWGGMLALEYALSRPDGLKALILSNSTSSAPLWGQEAKRLREQLPLSVQNTLAAHEQASTTDSEAYQTAMAAFYARHVCRLPVIPDFVQRSFNRIGQPYGVMWGPSEFYMTGNLAQWDVTRRLREIDLPVLLISGEHDESTPLINKTLHESLALSQWVMFEDCSHLTHVEAPERYLDTVDEFLTGLREAVQKR